MTMERTLDTVAGVFASPQQAETVMMDLRQLGLTDAEFNVAAPTPGRYRIIEGEVSPENLRRTLIIGALIGTLLGGLAGLALIGLFVPDADLVVGLVAGSLWGTFLGAAGGLLVRMWKQETHERIRDIPPGSSDVVVVARAGERAEQVRGIMRAHGALCYLDEIEPVRGAAIAPSPGPTP
jgi:hypothetical protein